MIQQDQINAFFEFFGGLLYWTNVKRIYKDKTVKGVNWYTVAFFNGWSLWNLYYYPFLGQWYSFVGGMSITLSQLVWLILFARYYRNV